MQAHHSQARREGSALQQDTGPLYDFNLDEELELELDEETMEAMFGQDLASDTDILGMWIPEVLDWPTWVCVSAGFCCFLFLPLTNKVFILTFHVTKRLSVGRLTWKFRV